MDLPDCSGKFSGGLEKFRPNARNKPYPRGGAGGRQQSWEGQWLEDGWALADGPNGGAEGRCGSWRGFQAGMERIEHARGVSWSLGGQAPLGVGRKGEGKMSLEFPVCVAARVFPE